MGAYRSPGGPSLTPCSVETLSIGKLAAGSAQVSSTCIYTVCQRGLLTAAATCYVHLSVYLATAMQSTALTNAVCLSLFNHVSHSEIN